MREIEESFDVAVCGGGLAGACAAVAAARHGARTCLIQDRPVLGGNSSSEIRVPPHGAACFHAYARETGILSEAIIQERAVNHEAIFENGWTNSVWDMVLYDLVRTTPNLTLHVNTAVVDVLMEPAAAAATGIPACPSSCEPTTDRGYYHRPACNTSRRIAAVVCSVSAAETQRTIRARTFIDCTGDGLVAHLAGCEWRMGSEGRDELGELHAPAQPSTETMGSSIHFRARDAGRPVPFVPPTWAVKHENPDYFYKQGRVPYTHRGGFWWIEIGVPWHTIHDAEDIRHELTRHCLGVWDWIKNRDPKLRDVAATWGLDWIGQVPGKRESRRIIGRYFMTEHDVLNKTVFPDEIAFGGWFVDLHTPGGLLADKSEPASAEGYVQTSEYAAKSYCGPYGIPLRSLIANDIDNLLMAGRNVSVTHAALGTVRVQGTTALMGQAAGTAAAVALSRGIEIHEAPQSAAREVQQALLRDGCFLPSVVNEDAADIARSARVIASSEMRLVGVGPGSRGHHEGLLPVRSLPVSVDADRLTHRRGQWIAVSAKTIRSISVCLSNTTDRPQNVEAWLHGVEHIWDYRTDPDAPLAHATLIVPPGQCQWIEWHTDVRVTPGRYVRLDLGANPDVAWHSAGALVPGHASAFQMSPQRMRRFRHGETMSFRVDPPQACFAPKNVLSGVTRPHRSTNLWCSDPADPLPQWIELAWDRPMRIACVELTFPGHLLREYHDYSPLYRDPQCAKDYTLSAGTGDGRRELVRVAGNYQRRRRHALDEPVLTDHLRLTVHATNGDPSAAVYEMRCYAE